MSSSNAQSGTEYLIALAILLATALLLVGLFSNEGLSKSRSDSWRDAQVAVIDLKVMPGEAEALIHNRLDSSVALSSVTLMQDDVGFVLNSTATAIGAGQVKRIKGQQAFCREGQSFEVTLHLIYSDGYARYTENGGLETFSGVC